MTALVLALLAVAVLLLAIAPHTPKPGTARFLQFAAAGLAVATIVIVLVIAERLG